jgi:hypothetical protein
VRNVTYREMLHFQGVEGEEEWKGGRRVEGGSFHPKIPMKRAIFASGGRVEAENQNTLTGMCLPCNINLTMVLG